MTVGMTHLTLFPVITVTRARVTPITGIGVTSDMGGASSGNRIRHCPSASTLDAHAKAKI
jgi:hypothetical protein